MNLLTRLGAIAFLSWGLLHIVGGIAILAALGESPVAGYGLYQNYEGLYTPLSGAILGYFAYFLICIAIAVTFIAIRLNWRNSQTGLAINTLLIGLTEAGLVGFLLLPGFVTWSEASLGLGLFLSGVVSAGISCNAQHRPTTVSA